MHTRYVVLTDNDADGQMAAAVIIYDAAKSGVIPDVIYTYQANWRRDCSKIIEELLSDDTDPRSIVWITDLSIDEETCDKLHAKFRSGFKVCDHHASAAWLKDKEYAHYDTDISACAIVAGILLGWKHSLVKLANYISDYDTWKFEKVNSREVNAYISTQNLKDMESVEKIAERLRIDFPALVTDGKMILDFINTRAKNKARLIIEDKCLLFTHHSKYYPLINLTENISDTLNEVLEATDRDPCMSYFINEFGEAIVSIRSRRGLAGMLAATFGGGGHPNAAGFKMDINEFVTKLTKRTA